MLMGASGLVASLPRLVRNTVTSLSGIAGTGDFAGSRAQDGGVVSDNRPVREKIADLSQADRV